MQRKENRQMRLSHLKKQTNSKTTGNKMYEANMRQNNLWT